MKEKEEVISQLAADMQRMKTTLGEVVVGEKSGGSILCNNVSGLRLEDDQEYFNSYSNYSIHHEMLSVRVLLSYCYSLYVELNISCLD